MLAGDTHANWASDIVWNDEKEYNPESGKGSTIGVEFAGTAVSSTGFGGTIASANRKSQGLVKDNPVLQWNEGYFRGYFELLISYDAVQAFYYGLFAHATATDHKH
jgi:alkaline phosphatase D